MKRANLIKLEKKKKYVLYPTNTITNGGGIASEPFVFLDNTVSYEELAEKLLEVLGHSKSNVDRPKDWKEFRKNYLKSMKVKTLKELYTNSLNVSVLMNAGLLKLTPTKNLGSKEGFQHSKSLESEELPEKSSLEEVAKAIEKTLSRCE